jgi:hypothetical protein
MYLDIKAVKVHRAGHLYKLPGSIQRYIRAAKPPEGMWGLGNPTNFVGFVIK